MKIAGPTDQAEIESILAHPAIEPFVHSDDGPWPVDVVPYLYPPHRALLFEGGCFLLAWQGKGRVECHTVFLPGFRGKAAMKAGAQGLEHIFLDTNVVSVVTKVPQNNPGADWFTRAMGFRLRFARPGAWLKHGERFPVRYYEIEIDDWIVRGHEGRVDARYAEVAALLAEHCNPEKARRIYNRWAMLAGCEMKSNSEGAVPCL